jgi:hypothetical protein
MMETETKSKRCRVARRFIWSQSSRVRATTLALSRGHALSRFRLATLDMPHSKQRGIIVPSGRRAHVFVFMLPDCCFWLLARHVKDGSGEFRHLTHCARTPFVLFLVGRLKCQESLYPESVANNFVLVHTWRQRLPRKVSRFTSINIATTMICWDMMFVSSLLILRFARDRCFSGVIANAAWTGLALSSTRFPYGDRTYTGYSFFFGVPVGSPFSIWVPLFTLPLSSHCEEVVNGVRVMGMGKKLKLSCHDINLSIRDAPSLAPRLWRLEPTVCQGQDPE